MNISDINLRNNNQSPMSRSAQEKDDIRCDSEFSRIEELIKGNTFSREEISHLMEILNSRVDYEWEKQKSSSNAGEDAQLVSWTNDIHRTPSGGKLKDIDGTMIGTSCKKSDVPVEVGASPIDIARAYMAGRTSEVGHNLFNFMSTGERAQPNNEVARNPLLLSPSPKPSICWPGAMVHDHHGYTTPQSQRGRHRLHDFPRTPYSRTISSKSRSRLQGDSHYANTSTPFQQSQSSIYGQVKSRGDNTDIYGSVGPIRRIRNKFASEVRPRGSIFQTSSKDIPSKTVTHKAFGGFLPSTEKNLEPGETSGTSKYFSGDDVSGSSDRDISNPNLSSSQAVRKILEHLDRNKPTPKEKEAELKLATAWRRSSTPEAPDTFCKENISSHKNTVIAGPKFPVELTSSSKSNFSVKFHDKGTDEAKDAGNGNAKASSTVFPRSNIIPGSNAMPYCGLKATSDVTGSNAMPSLGLKATSDVTGSNAMPSFGFKASSDAVVKNLNENTFSTTNQGQSKSSFQFSRPPLSNGQDAKKHSVPSISIKKPDFRADNGPGFTFPVSASSGVLSEPPTPSIMPTSSASILSQPVGVSTIPSYAFGANKSTPRLVFSFPSASSASTIDDFDLKFSFGSDKNTRLSFTSFGKDAICY